MDTIMADMNTKITILFIEIFFSLYFTDHTVLSGICRNCSGTDI